MGISVTDTGTGIQEETMGRLLKPFSQIELASTKIYECMGLRLGLTKRFGKAHGGSIGVESEFGKGSTFTFALALLGKINNTM